MPSDKYVKEAEELVKAFRAAKSESEQEEILCTVADSDLAVVEALIRTSSLGNSEG